MEPTQKTRLYIIDGHSYIYRAYYAIRGLSTSSGIPTNAVFGFANMLLKVIKEKNPDLVAIAFDSKGPTRRHKEYQEYKSHRPPMPGDLASQIPYIHKLLDAFRIPKLMEDGQEADDIIASLAYRAVSEGMDVTIVTGDKDLFQLVGPRIAIYDTLKEKLYGPAEVEEKFGVPPGGVIEILGLMGDSSDNIPGVPGIGEKTAQMLIRQYGSIDNLLNRADEITKPKLRQNLRDHAELARFSRDLARLQTDLPLSVPFSSLTKNEPDNQALVGLLRELEFTALLKHVTQAGDGAECRTVLTRDELNVLLDSLSSASEFSFIAETASPSPLTAELAGISLAVSPGLAFYIPLNEAPIEPDRLKRQEVLEGISPFFKNPLVGKISHNIKFQILALSRYGITFYGPLFDTMIASYLLNPGRTSHTLEALALEYLQSKVTNYDDIAGAGKKRISFREIAMEAVARYSAEKAELIFRLKQALVPPIRDHGLGPLFHDIEMPLAEVLAEIEQNGIKIDCALLKTMSQNLEKELTLSEDRIYALAGTRFNINSTKQLADILFVKLGLPSAKKTKTGFSTNVDVLEELARIHALPAEILKYRSLAKLKSTYVDALPLLINPDTSRLHTSLNQTVTATGRLSSSDPNLQNIPVRTGLGREIRKAFIAEPGGLLLSADYSQIELRILAHMSGDQDLINTFMNNEDVHSHTAMELFGLSAEDITQDMRRKAKAVNFGIIYGISPFGLAQDIGVSNAEAKRYIDRYFTRFPGVKNFLEHTIEQAKKNGFVTTLFGRKRFLPELAASSAPVRNFGERMAVNTPIQGTAADIIKVAMIRISRRIKDSGFSSRMILQVHDELVFEMPEKEAEGVKKLVKEEMEGAAALSVPIVVELGVGGNWDDAH